VISYNLNDLINFFKQDIGAKQLKLDSEIFNINLMTENIQSRYE